MEVPILLVLQWKVELNELRKLIVKVYDADSKENDGKVKVFRV
jgi:hypothetical protein